MENVCLKHLEWDQHLIIIFSYSQVSIYCRLHQNNHLSVEKLLSRLSAFQEIFAVEDPMFIVQMTADVPVSYPGCALHSKRPLTYFI